jgi:membrane-bound serine protease (ClpP class)
MIEQVSLPLLLVLIGLLLLVLEVLLPAWGFLGIGAAVALVAGVWLAFHQSTGLGLVMLAAEAVSVPMALGGSFVIWRALGWGRRTELEPPTADELDVSHSGKDLGLLIGRVGRSVTQLGPSGHVEFDNRELEGVSVDGIVPAETLVEAVSVRLGRVMVRRHTGARAGE